MVQSEAMYRTEQHQEAPGVVVIYSPNEGHFGARHEKATRAEIAKRLAAIKGFEFAGVYDPSACYAGPLYFVPSDTLVVAQAAHELDIRSEQDLFGGVVPTRHVATKAITHPLVSPEAFCPADWSHEFGPRVHDAVLFGFTVFAHEDARRAGAQLLEHGPLRIKPVRATGGRGKL